MEEKRPHPTTGNPPKTPTGAALYLRWLAVLCAVMAAFCLGVFLIGYKEPSFGRVATFAGLAVACPVLLYLSKRKARP